VTKVLRPVPISSDVRLDPRLAFPLTLVGLGVAGLAGAMVAQRRSDQQLAAGPDRD
jgi:hypothetical protein